MVQANPISEPHTEEGIISHTRLDLKHLEPAPEIGNPKIIDVNNVHLCKDHKTSLTELVSDTQEMRTDCTLSNHESIVEYRNHP